MASASALLLCFRPAPCSSAFSRLSSLSLSLLGVRLTSFPPPPTPPPPHPPPSPSLASQHLSHHQTQRTPRPNEMKCAGANSTSRETRATTEWRAEFTGLWTGETRHFSRTARGRSGGGCSSGPVLLLLLLRLGPAGLGPPPPPPPPPLLLLLLGTARSLLAAVAAVAASLRAAPRSPRTAPIGARPTCAG